MKSIDALYELFNNIKSDANYGEMVEARNIIEKDLEIAQILKNSMSVESETFEDDNNEVVEYEYIACNGWDIDIKNKEEYNKIKEWLLK